MKLLRTRLMTGCCCLALACAAVAQQGRGPGGPPSAPRGGPGGLGGPGSPGNVSPNANNTSAQPNAASISANAAGTAQGGLAFGPPGRWWDDRSVTSSIGLKSAQQKQMDAIFDANKSAIVSSYATLMTQQARLDAINKQTSVDSKTLFAAIDSVNQARASLQKATSEMLLQIRGAMSADQIAKLQKLH